MPSRNRTMFRFVAVVATFVAVSMAAAANALGETERAVRVVLQEAKASAAKPADANKKPETKDGKKDDAKDESKESKDGKEEPEGPKPIQRPTTPSEKPDPEELKLKPDENNRFTFNFKGQPWPGVLEWLADVSDMYLDWQELPGDYLNLVTQRSYSVSEAHDLINRALLARGYTLLRQGEGLTVVNIKKLNPGMVPRVRPEELADRDPHEFVKASFTLDWLIAETAVEELKPMLSPNGKLTALNATNRLEAIDSVANLREIWTVLQEEQSGSGQRSLVREFKLKHTRAGDVLLQLEGLLGIKRPVKSEAPKTREQVQLAMMQAQAAAQRAKQQNNATAAKPKAEIYLVVNHRENSILAQAPPDKFAVIAQAIDFLDVPSSNESLLLNMDRMQVYRLAALDPEPFVQTLQQVADLDPTTQLEVDKKNKAIIAYASLADHLMIRNMISKLDGSGRSMEVIPLRRLEADYVAGTIQFMINGEEDDDNQNNRYRYYYGYGGGNNDDKDTDKFRVDADIEFNRLVLWANDIELREVNILLAKLGEIPPEGGNRSTVRMIDSLDASDRDKLLERIRRIWPSIGPNELITPPVVPEEKPPETKEVPKKLPEKAKAATADATPAANRADGIEERIVSVAPKAGFVALANLQAEQTDVAPQGSTQDPPRNTTDGDLEPGVNNAPAKHPKAANGLQSPGAPPISITVAPDGRLVISSQDTNALDKLEELLSTLAPPRREFEVFELKYATAFWVSLNLEDFFEEEEEETSGRNSFDYWYYGYRNNNNKTESTRRLSRRRPLKFISDDDTNTILVQGADPAQLQTIAELIKLYDRPEPTDSESARKSKVFQIQYSKVKVVADVIKDVYRDLLSSNDKALQKHNENQKKQASERNYTYIYGGADSQSKTRVGFKGLLSIGVDELSNTLVVSAQENLLNAVAQTIADLDRAARPNSTVQLFPVDQGINSAILQRRLADIFSQQKRGQQQTNEQEQQQKKQQQQDEQLQQQQQQTKNGSVVIESR